LPVLRASSGERIEHGRIYVGVPGVHLLLHDSHLLLRRGPRENLVRPAIDPLFRSAACAFGARVIGVVLSGALNDGAAGLRAIKRCGGIAVVQDPSDAAVADMPRSALRYAEVDHVAPAGALGALLARMSREPAGETPRIPPEIRLETAIAAQEEGTTEKEEKLGTSAGGIDALKRLFPNVDPASGMAFVVVQHLAPDHGSALAELLARSTPLPVTSIRNPTTVDPNHVYVIPPNAALTIRDGRLLLAKPQGRVGSATRSTNSSSRWPATRGKTLRA
jgi:chemotaxis response regulator CheB